MHDLQTRKIREKEINNRKSIRLACSLSPANKALVNVEYEC